MVRIHSTISTPNPLPLDANNTSTEGDSATKEFFAAWTLFIAIMLLIAAFFTSYMLQTKKVTAIHETVISIFAGTAHALYCSCRSS